MKKISRRDAWIGFAGAIIGAIITIIPSMGCHKSDNWLISWGNELVSGKSATSLPARTQNTAFTMAAQKYLLSKGDTSAATQLNDYIDKNTSKVGAIGDDQEGREMVARTQNALNVLNSN